ncbi:MAG: alpha/beta hydrolase, partial [Dehalococcoidia bacterium]|nr:alpha/beta hydrolase [Dehalococcoidia bacterium]
MSQPQVRFAEAGERRIAYTSSGTGAPIVVLPVLKALGSYVQVITRSGGSVHFDQLADHFQIIRFDRTNTGLSDRVPESFDLESMARDLDVLAECFKPEKLILTGFRETCPYAIYWAATRPAGVRALILNTPFTAFAANDLLDARHSRALAYLADDWEFFTEVWALASIGNGTMRGLAPHIAEDLRLLTNAEEFRRQLDAICDVDATEHLAHVSIPALVLHQTNRDIDGAWPPVSQIQLCASRISGSQFVRVDGPQSQYQPIVDFLLGEDGEPAASRSTSFRTILFTDVVASTPLLTQLRDAKMREVMHDHDTLMEAAVTG